MNADTLTNALRAFVSRDITVAPFGDRRFASDTPLFYPDGDSVVVYLTEQPGAKVEVTDYGEGYTLATARRGSRRRQVSAVARDICGALGVEFADGRISTVVDEVEVADAVWRIASASARLADAITFSRAEAPREEDVFTDEVESTMRKKEIPVQREPRLVGDSGHEYRPSLFIPTVELIVEPIQPEVAWLRAASVYVEFGDLAQANSYRLMAVLDDRERAPQEEIVRLLSQVGDVAEWSRRDAWLRRLAEPSG